MSHCAFCDVILSESELRMIDPLTNEQRGCNRCWGEIQGILYEFEDKEDEDHDVLGPVEVVSLEEIDYEHELDESGDFTD